MPISPIDLASIELPPVKATIETPSYDLVSKIAPMITRSEYARIQAALSYEDDLSQITFIQKNSSISPYSLTFTPEGIVYIHFGKRRRLVGEGSFKKVYECVRLQGNTVTLMAEARIKDTAQIEKAFKEDDLAKQFSSAYNIDGSETAFVYLSKRGTLKARFMQPLMAKDGLQFFCEDHSVIERMRVIEEVARGLKPFHDAGYLHRDIKPENILIDDTGHAKLADVGLAILYSEMTDPAGTPGFVPADVLPSGAMVFREPQTVKTDLFSLGVTMYEIMGKSMSTAPQGFDKLVLDLTEDDPMARPSIDKVIATLQAMRSRG